MSQLDLNFFETIFTYKCLTDETYLSSVIDYTTPDLFQNKDIRAIISVISDFYARRSTVPTLTELKVYLSDENLKKSLTEVVGQFNKIDKNFNTEELYENTEQFIKERGVYNTILSIMQCGNKKINTSEILQNIEKSCNICLNHDIGLDLLPQIGRVITDLKTERNAISTGWKWVDSKIQGGLFEKGRALYVFAGQTNVGKSIFLGNIATAIAKQNKTVLVVSLEMSEMLYAQRLCANITKIPINTLKSNTDILEQQIKEFRVAQQGSRIIIKEFPPSTITVNNLKAFIKKLRSNGIKIDAVVVDYVNLLHSPTGNNSYERVKHSAEQLRALSYEFKCPFITATQLNRQSVNTENPGLETISESMALAATADVIWSIWQDDTDRDLGVIKLGFMKNRMGPNFGSRSLKIDYNTLLITEDDYINDTEEVTSSTHTLEKLANQIGIES